MKRSDLDGKPGTVFRYERTTSLYSAIGFDVLTFVVDEQHPSTPSAFGKLHKSTAQSSKGVSRDVPVRVLWQPPAAKPKRSELKPGTVFRYLDGPSANWEMYVPVIKPDRYFPEYQVSRPHADAPVVFKNARSSNPGPNDLDKEVEVLWTPPDKPPIVPPVKTPPVVDKGKLASKIANRPKLDSLANGLAKLSYEEQAAKLKQYPVYGDINQKLLKAYMDARAGFNVVFPIDERPVKKVPPPLPTEDKARKALPVFTGPLMYFPHALLQIGAVCKAGNDQHNPGEPMHWAREKSTDQMNTALRHMMDHGLGNTKDTDGQYHLAKAAWRILAELQLTIERDLSSETK